MMRAAMNHDALPKRMFDAISEKFISLFLINSLGTARREVNTKYGNNRYLPMACSFLLIWNAVSLYKRKPEMK